MLEYTESIRKIAEKILTDGTVEMVIGFRRGTLPLVNEPHFVRNAADVKELVWDSSCGINLANYLTERKEKIGIVAKGCDSRNIVTHIIENKIKRDQLYIIGVPCKGMIDRRKAARMLSAEIENAVEKDGEIRLKGSGEEKTVKRADLLQDNCAICIHRNPVVYDELAAEPVAEQRDVDRYADIRRIEAMSAQEKGRFFDDLLSPCIRCYACRNACPLCYCPTCFVDESRPQWVGKGQDAADVRTFHLLRAYHCAGRCTDCGACERACPMEIKVRLLTRKMEKDCLELFNWEAGLLPEARPALDTYKPEDPDEFIR